MAASENFKKEISAIKSSIYSFYRSWHLKSKEASDTTFMPAFESVKQKAFESFHSRFKSHCP